MKQASFKICSLSVSSDELWILNELKRLAKLEGVSLSELVRRAAKEYIEKHRNGNPQTPLYPHMEPMVIPTVEKRRDNLQEIVNIIKLNPGVDEVKLAARLSIEFGLRLETIRDYVKVLMMSRAIYRSGGKLYVTERVQFGAEKTES